jgi:hypothetical protein
MQVFDGGSQLGHAHKPAYFVGLDLGQSQDYSALVILERRGFSPQNYTFDCRYLKRWELRTSFPQIVEDTVRLVNSESLNADVKERPVLAVDATGCGAAVIDLFRREQLAGKLIPVLITAGAEVTRDSYSTKIPKRDLVGAIAVALQSGKLKISEELELTKILTAELQNFRAKISDSGHDSYNAGAANGWREGAHDDLLLALALAVWCASGNVKTPTFYSF